MKKVIDDRGRVFGLINLIDLGIILLLVILGVKIVSAYLPARINQKRTPVTICLLIKNAPPYVEESLIVGQDLFTDDRDAYLGKIHSKNVKPAELLVVKNGSMALVKSPRNFDIRLEVIRMEGRIVKGPSRTGVYLGKQAVRIGDYLHAHTLYTSVAGEVEYLKIHAKKGAFKSDGHPK